MKLTPRRQNIISGLCALVLVGALTTLGVKFAFGAFDAGYELVASFDAAGQGLIRGSDIKVRGLDIGHVQEIELVDGRAEVTMFIGAEHRIPTDATFTIRPKTLFGEKFVDVDLGEHEVDGPWFDPDAPLEARTVPFEQTTGSVELERVLSNLQPILDTIESGDLAIVLDTFARAGEGLGETINRTIVNSDRVLAVTAARDAETRRFLDALASLSDELVTLAPDLLAGADDLNVALPVLIEEQDRFSALLRQTERVAGELAGLLEGNVAFIDSVYGDAQVVLDTLETHRAQVIPTVVGLRQYVQTLAEAGRIPLDDGTVMAAVKGLLGGEVCGLLLTCPVIDLPALPSLPPLLPSLPLGGSGSPAGAATTADTDGGIEPPADLDDGARDIFDLLTDILRGGGR